MNLFLIFIAGVVGGVIGMKLWGCGAKKDAGGNGEAKDGLIARQAREKERNKRSILGILETQSPLTNNHIEQLLGISDATATRYLEELEKEGRVRQVGGTGSGVHYERVK